MALLYDPDAFLDVPHHEVERVLEKIDWIWANHNVLPHSSLSGKLSGYYKRPVGNKCRVIYSIDDDTDDMIIHLVGQRKTIYKEAEKRLS